MLYSPRVMDTPVDTWLGTPRSLTCRQFVRAQQTVALENSQHLDGLRCTAVDDAVVVDGQFAKTPLGNLRQPAALLRILGQRIASIDQLVDKASSSSRWRRVPPCRDEDLDGSLGPIYHFDI